MSGSPDSMVQTPFSISLVLQMINCFLDLLTPFEIEKFVTPQTQPQKQNKSIEIVFCAIVAAIFDHTWFEQG